MPDRAQWDVPVAKLGGIFKRMETDAEYRVRLIAAGHRSGGAHGHPVEDFKGALLDDFGDAVGMQRRIVESSAD